MANGDTLVVFTAQHNEPPSSNFATLDTRNDILVLDFDDTTDESAEFGGLMPAHYAGGDISIMIGWMSTDTTITAGHQCRWDVAWKSVSGYGDDLDVKAFAAVQSVSSDESSSSGEVKYIEITFTNAQADFIGADEYFRLLITRDANHGDDDLGDDAELVFIRIADAT